MVVLWRRPHIDFPFRSITEAASYRPAADMFDSEVGAVDLHINVRRDQNVVSEGPDQRGATEPFPFANKIKIGEYAFCLPLLL